jgi:5-methylcytosine-specific restriction endonuclease McrA
MARKQKVYQGRPCPYCGERLVASRSDSRLFPTKDHLNPRALGGGPWIIVCRGCNNRKGCMPLEEWLALMKHERPHQIPAIMEHIGKVRYALYIPKDSKLRSVLAELAAL